MKRPSFFVLHIFHGMLNPMNTFVTILLSGKSCHFPVWVYLRLIGINQLF